MNIEEKDNIIYNIIYKDLLINNITQASFVKTLSHSIISEVKRNNDKNRIINNIKGLLSYQVLSEHIKMRSDLENNIEFYIDYAINMK